MPGCSWVAAWLPIRHRRRAHVALQVPELLLGQVLVPVDAVHDLQRARLAAGGVAEAPLQPLHERAGLLGEPEPEQRVEREGGVAHPRVAVVPVAYAAELLRQAGGGRRLLPFANLRQRTTAWRPRRRCAISLTASIRRRGTRRTEPTTRCYSDVLERPQPSLSPTRKNLTKRSTKRPTRSESRRISYGSCGTRVKDRRLGQRSGMTP